MKTMIKRILAIVLLISLDASAQNDLVFNQEWSDPEKLPFTIMEGLYFTDIEGKLYSEFEILQDESVFYPDIERSENHAKFLEINKNLQLKQVSDTTLSKNLFLKTDFRTEWSEFIHVERGYNSDKNDDGNWTHNWEVNCNYGGEAYTENFSYRSISSKWHGVRSSLVSDESGLNAVFLGHSCLDGVFAKIYFIHFNPATRKIELIEKDLTYADLGYNSQNIVAVSNYSNEFRLGNLPGMLLSFNLDNSSALGISTLIFDLETNEIKISSKKISDSELPIIKEFNEISAEINIYGNTINYFIHQYRGKISQGDESNTTLNSESSNDILYLEYENGIYSDAKNFSGVRKTYHLQKSVRLNNDFIFVYDKEPEDLEVDEKKIVGKDSKIKLWIVQYSANRTVLYEVGFNYSKLDKSIFENYLSFVKIDNSSFQIIVYLSGDMFEPTKDYLIGKINITQPK
jgi:hypothetical protein